MKKRRTKKYRRYRKNKSFKIKIGGELTNVSTTSINDNASLNANMNNFDLVNPNMNMNPDVNTIDELTSKIEEQHSLNKFLPDFNLGNSTIVKKIVELSQGLAMKVVDRSAQFLNINLNDSEQFKQSLEELKVLLNDPKNIALMKEVVAEFAKVGIIALDAARPFIDELITEIFDKLKIIGSQWGQTGVKVALNTLEEVPGYGIIVGSIRSVSNIGEAFFSTTNAAAEVWTRTSDNVNAAVQNFDKLLQEKNELITRTGGSIKKFLENGVKMPKNIKKYNKTKKVRFNL